MSAFVTDKRRTVVAGIVRVILLDNFDRHIPENYTHSVLFCVSTIEVGLSFVAACAPSFKPLVTRLVPKLFGSTRTGPYGGSTNRSGRGYNLENGTNFSRRENDQTITVVEGGDHELGYGPKTMNPKNMITMTTQMEVTWAQSNREDQDTSSMESLVHAK
jgi:hypothetical protein